MVRSYPVHTMVNGNQEMGTKKNKNHSPLETKASVLPMSYAEPPCLQIFCSMDIKSEKHSKNPMGKIFEKLFYGLVTPIKNINRLHRKKAINQKKNRKNLNYLPKTFFFPKVEHER